MSVVEYQRGDYVISTDKSKLDPGSIHSFLNHSSYWAQERSLDTIQKSLEHSLCFGVYRGAEQVGFARVVTDYATFAWLCDVFILEPHRDRGLGKWLVESVVAHPQLADLGIFLLATRDAHELYRRHSGFEVLESAERWMIRRRD